MESEVKKPFLLKALLALLWTVLGLWTVFGVVLAVLFALMIGYVLAKSPDALASFAGLAVAAFSGGVSLLLNGALLVAAGRGRNWARVSMIVSFVIDMVVFLVTGVALVAGGEPEQGAAQFVGLCFVSVPVLVLLRPSVVRWYGQCGNPGRELHNAICCAAYWGLSVVMDVAFFASFSVMVWKLMVDQDGSEAKSVAMLKFQADCLDDADAMVTLGTDYLYGLHGIETSHEKAFAYFDKAAAKNVRGGLNGAARCYELGWGTAKDLDKAYAHYMKAYETGSVYAMNALGDCCEKGIGTETNLAKAVEWWTLAADRNHGWAACKVALRHQKDNRPDEAFAWFRKAADIGSDYACCKLGECYERGWGTPTNAVEAARWFVEGAERNHPWGMEKAGDCHATGYGVEKDVEKAREWYEKAVKRNGSKSAEKKLKALNAATKGD